MTDPPPPMPATWVDEIDNLDVWSAGLSGAYGETIQTAAAGLEAQIELGEVDPIARVQAVEYVRRVAPEMHARALAEARRHRPDPMEPTSAEGPHGPQG